MNTNLCKVLQLLSNDDHKSLTQLTIHDFNKMKKYVKV